MRNYFIRLFLAILIFPHVLFATRVDLFSTGQGNTVMVTYRRQTILIDAGSSESKFRALYHEKSVKAEDQFVLLPTESQGGGFAGASSTKRKATSHDDASTDSPSGSSPEKQADIKRKRAEQEKIRQRYMQGTLEDIRGSFPKDDSGGPVLKAVITTHADEDHYNLIPQIFNEHKVARIEHMILSGFAEDYQKDFRAWLEFYRPLIGHIIFTGMYDGSERKEMAEGVRGYARAYFSGMPNPTEAEQRIEAALRFTPEEGEVAVPLWQILSMNAGHATEPNGIVRIANKDKNTNSLVLRVQVTGGRSFVLAGDAEDGTWEHVRANFWGHEQDLETSHLLISHHGSKEEGATRPDILSLFKPKACFLSVGRHQKYHHPHQDTLQVLLSLPSLLQTKNHAVSYFGLQQDAFVHKRRQLSHAIFSTLNHGKLFVILEESDPTVHTSSYREKTHESSGTEHPQYFSVDYDNVYCVVPGQSMEPALAELTGYFQAQGIRGIFWEKVAPKSHQIRPREPIMPAVEGCQERDVLVNQEKNRFYFLEKFEEGGERRMRARRE